MILETELAWAAGFFDGEGSIVLYKRKTIAHSLRIEIAQVDRRVLDKFALIFNLGRTKGPYGPYSEKQTPYFKFLASGDEARSILTSIWPWLSETKKTQAGRNGFKI